MKTKIYLVILGTLVMILPGFSFGQKEVLREMLKDKTTFREITETFEQYFSTAPESFEKEKLEKHFARWAYYQSLHLGPDGEFVNINKKTLEAVGNLTDAPLTSANGSWTFVGPNSVSLNNPSADLLGNGRADRIAFHPTNASIIYVGTPSGGLWKTTNGGTSWTSVTNFIPSLGISGIVVDYSDPNTLYVLTGDGDADISNGLVFLAGYVQLSAGVLVSHDAGATWQQTGQLSANNFVGFRLIQHPTNPDILIAATSDGIYRTTNGGTTWVQELAGKFYDVEFKPGTPSKVYASGVAMFRYSDDTGDTWNAGATFDYALCAGGRVEIAVTPDYANKVYLFAAPQTGANSFCGFYVSTNSGSSFTRLCTTPNVLGDESGSGDQSEYDMGVAVKPTDDQIVIVGGLIIYKSTNGGTSFTHATHYRESGGTYIHPDIHYVAYNPLNNYLYASGDGGFHRSTDDGVTWTDLYTSMNTAQFYHFDDYDANQYTILAGCQDNGVKYRTTNTTAFSHINCCDGAEQAIDYTDQTTGFSAVNKSIKHFTNFTTTSPTTIVTSNFFPQIELNSSDPTLLYFSFNTVYVYDLGLGTYTQIGDNTIHGPWVIRTCPSNANRIYTGGGTAYYATTGELFTSSNAGVNWTNISDNPGFPATYNRVSDIGVRPNSSGYIYACISGYTAGVKVYYSSDAGLNWTNVSYDLPNTSVWSCIVDASNDVYVGTDIGVFYRANGSTHWEPYYNYLPLAPVSDLEINEGADQLLAATFGRGIWKSPLSACPVSTTISSNVSGHFFSTASTSITMSGQLTGGLGTDVALRAGSYIDLTPGFRADADPGNKFHGYLGPCGSGMPTMQVTGADLYPVYPDELSAYEMKMTRNEGTLQVSANTTSLQRTVTLRLFTDGPARILLAEPNGTYIKDIANLTGTKGKYTYSLDTSTLSKGVYYLYLVVNNKVMHLQEVEVE